MTFTIDLKPETEAWLELQAARHGQPTAEYIRTALEGMRSLSPTEEAFDEGATEIEAGWASFTALIDKHQMDMGISDFAHQHDHYIHGTPKRED